MKGEMRIFFLCVCGVGVEFEQSTLLSVDFHLQNALIGWICTGVGWCYVQTPRVAFATLAMTTHIQKNSRVA